MSRRSAPPRPPGWSFRRAGPGSPRAASAASSTSESERAREGERRPLVGADGREADARDEHHARRRRAERDPEAAARAPVPAARRLGREEHAPDVPQREEPIPERQDRGVLAQRYPQVR